MRRNGAAVVPRLETSRVPWDDALLTVSRAMRVARGACVILEVQHAGHGTGHVSGRLGGGPVVVQAGGELGSSVSSRGGLHLGEATLPGEAISHRSPTDRSPDLR